jgi:hypothetical protein
MRTQTPAGQPGNCLVIVLLTATGRNVWGTLLNVPHPEPKVVDWLEKRSRKMGSMWAGELVAELIGELGAVPRGKNAPAPLPERQ